MPETWCVRARALVLCGAALLSAVGCDLDTVGSLDRLPPGSPERLRILAPTEPASTDAILSVTVERLAREDDELGRDPTRVRCVVVRTIGAARLVDLAMSGSGTLSTREELAFDIDRGESRQLGLVAVTDGSALVWARLLDGVCPASSEASSLAETSRTVRFEAGELLPLDVDAGDGA